MRRWPIAVVFGFALAAASPAVAGEDKGTIYGGVRAIGSVAAFGDVNTVGFTGTTTIQNDSDEVAGIAGVLGYSFGRFPFRAEVEVGYRFRFDFDVRDVAAQTIDYEMNVATTSALASAIIEWRNDTDFTPFAGVTAGWARSSTDTQRVNLATQVKTTTDEDADNFAYGGVLGLDWGFSENWSAEFAYRYLNLGEVKTGVINTTDSISADDYASHDVLFSILYRF
jgi:opacity protein-like surface antigen